MKGKKKRLEKVKVKNLYISLLVLFVLLLMVVFYTYPRFQGFVIQDGTFNLEVKIPSAYAIAKQGEEIHFTTKILNLDNKQRMDISLRYEMLNEADEIIASKTETMAIETQASFVGDLKVPEDVNDGEYDLRVVLLVNDVEVAEGRGSFEVMKEKNKTTYYTYVIVISIISLSLLVCFVIKSKVILEKIRTRNKIHSMVKRKLRK